MPEIEDLLLTTPVTPEELEEAYRAFFQVETEQKPLERMDLRQRPVTKIVRSVITYGAYDQPI